MDEAMSFLLPALVLLVAGTAALLATRVWKARKRLGSRAGGSRRGRAAPGAEGSPRQGPAAPGSPPYIPCGCGPGCAPCAAAARELQELLAPLWPGLSFPRDAETWQLLWEDLEQLLERGHLPCCASSSSCSSCGSPHPSQSPSESCQTPEGEEPLERCHRSLGVRRSCSSLRMHVAKKNLEVKLRVRPVPVRRSQQQQEAFPASPPSSESLLCCESLSGSCQTPSPDGEDAMDNSTCSSGSADVSGARSALRMHVAKKSLEVKLGAQPAPVRNSHRQVAQQELSWRPRWPARSSHRTAVQPKGNVLRSESEKILQRQRELEFPHLRGAPPRQMRLLLAAQILLRMLCFK